ncbi:hypothetical protein A2303_01945 [Candidatus Falkowbacteria bacterium RIFOXYB2_FULL_47_14]|uniref:Host attachment protein n=1 Tax=Candidatus Falkowbacteria bacterium RIFOXYA2_FULL_47_19 TaxID=1797994 RepID=A0A1F5SN82_9BACT|nr:MAG: hypothetical protein A2227_06745 [Candidatus Falkowbacteria bacterium RIFOXYA2_FULL_47_19]OGF34595.1 MAG: hypothetical protein A2468_07845 [Candidatus Falkowbacteria bacterium RIFOXYC2_FULL_46_15]OGF43214.1 MAG: hypothetical protein A2303_01945 [Candidatus Falkowbacteria bacterium RIFOXYB2_FULL_47_14]
MKISDKLPQFSSERVLIIASGQSEAVIYRAEKSMIYKREGIKQEIPKYTDREGLFRKSSRKGGRTETAAHGSVYENKKRYVKAKFVKNLIKRIREEQRGSPAGKVYLILPDFMAGEIERDLPGDLKRTIRLIRSGILTDSHPFDLIRTVRDFEGKDLGMRVPRNKDALKLMEKSSPEKL